MQQPRRLVRLTCLSALIGFALVLAGGSRPWPAAETTYASDAAHSPLAAAAISFANPGALTTTVAAGDDFATSVLGDAWDMDAARDLGYEIGFTNISASGGIWTGTYSGVDRASGAASSGYFFPLFQGFSTPIAGKLSQELAFNKIGAQDRYAVDTTKYTRLSYRLSVSARSKTSGMGVYWTTAKPVTWPDGSNRFLQIDACRGTSGFFPWSGWHLYNFDLTQPNGDAGVRAGTWQSQVRGLRIDPSSTGPAGTQVSIDWIRLSDPSSAPTITIPWNTSGAGPSDKVDIYEADNPAGTNAAPLVYGLAASAGSYSLPTSILPPGNHYFQLRLQDGSQENGCTVTTGTSAWVGPLGIETKPVITFAKPSMSSGPDYATEVLSQPWDMTASDDIVTPGPPYPRTIAGATFSNGVFSARAQINAPQTESDSQIWLHVDPSKPINTARYRYFTVRMKLDLPAGKDINWAVSNGWGGRVIWWNTSIQADGSESKYGTYYEGWRNYSVDLSRAVPPQPLANAAQADNVLVPREQDSFPAQLGWTALGALKNLRFDPLETTSPAVGTGADNFSIDWVKLTANDEVKSGSTFVVETGINVDPASLQSISFYYTTNRQQPTQNAAVRKVSATSPQFGNRSYLPLLETPAVGGQVEVTGNPLSFPWDTTGVAAGTYYICGRATLGSTASTYCSDTPVVVLP